MLNNRVALKPTSPIKIIGNIILDKLKWTLLPWVGLEEVVRVLMYGAEKHGDFGWLEGDIAENISRHYDAAFRHIIEWGDNSLDEETGRSHLAHAVCRLLFIITIEKLGNRNANTSDNS